MKTIMIISIVLASVQTNCYSQYYIFPSIGWNQNVLQLSAPPNGWNSKIDTFTCTRDTIISGQNYQVVLWKTKEYFIRNENGKIYQRTDQMTDKLWYDFTMEVGDTLKGYFYPSGNIDYIVTSREVIVFNSDSLIKIQLQADQWTKMTWQEGSGNLEVGFVQRFGIEESYQHICTTDSLGKTIGENSELFSPEGIDCNSIHGIDMDNDGFRSNYDCDDNNSNINPEQVEVPYNGIDDDCNPSTIDDDLDQDGFVLSDDCNDNNSNINPEQVEEPYNGIDDDCNPATLDDDLDQDGFVLSNDCDDNNSSINPDSEEIPDNGIDEDCDGEDLTTRTHELANPPFKIYPNPSIGVIHVQGLEQSAYNIFLFDLNGKLLLSGIKKNQIEINSLHSRMYLLEIREIKSGKVTVEKVIVQQ